MIPRRLSTASPGPGAQKVIMDRRLEVEALAVEAIAEQVKQTGMTARKELASGGQVCLSYAPDHRLRPVLRDGAPGGHGLLRADRGQVLGSVC